MLHKNAVCLSLMRAGVNADPQYGPQIIVETYLTLLAEQLGHHIFSISLAKYKQS
jgi:hypothetical protein